MQLKFDEGGLQIEFCRHCGKTGGWCAPKGESQGSMGQAKVGEGCPVC